MMTKMTDEQRRKTALQVLIELTKQSIPTEQAFLGALLLCQDDDQLRFITSTVTSDYFSYEPHRHIYNAIVSVYRQGRWDLVSVLTELERMGMAEVCGGFPYLIQLQDLSPTIMPMEFLETLTAHFLKRQVTEQMIRFLQAVPSLEPNLTALAQSLSDLYDGFKQRLATLQHQPPADVSFGHTFKEWLKSLSEPSQKIQSGLYDLDELLDDGVENGSLVLVGARPSHGKTAFLLQWFTHTALSGFRASFLSYEMTTNQIIQRIIAQQAWIPYSLIPLCFSQNGASLTAERTEDIMKSIVTAASRLAEKECFIEFCPDNLISVRLKLLQQKMNDRKIDILFVDYLQQIRPPVRREHRYQEVGDIVRELKRWAREYEMVVVAAVQLSRATESRADKRPTLADLRESGDLEAEADVVILLHPLEQRFQTTVNGFTVDGRHIDFLVAKNRNGRVGAVTFGFLPAFLRFVPLTKEGGV